MNPALKAAAENLLVTAGASRLGAYRKRADTLILAYHNIVPDGARTAGERTLHLPQRLFAAQLDALSRYCDIVPLDVALDLAARGNGRPRVAITFDDAYRGAITAGVQELARRGLPATIFVAPAFIGGASFWWDSYTGLDAVSPSAGFRHAALAECRGLDTNVREWAADAGVEAGPLPKHATAATEEDLSSAVERAPVTLGSHTWSHANLTRLSSADLESELARPLDWLQARFERVTRWLSYPYGLSSPAVQAAAARAGYAGGLEVEGGWVPGVIENSFAVPRLNVPSGLSTSGFALRISGVLSG